MAPTRQNGFKRELHRPRRRPLPHHQVELEVLHRRVERLLDDVVQAVDLVDEEDVAAVEVREQRGEVAGTLEHGPGGAAHADRELVRDDVRERRLPEPRRPAEEDVVQHVAARACRLDLHAQVLAHLLLADVLVERARPERRLDEHLVLELDRA